MTPIFYFILLKCLMKNICCLIFHLKLPFPLSNNKQFVFPPITYCFMVKILKSIWSSTFLLIYFLTVHSKTNLNQSSDSNDYNAPIPKYTIVWDWIIYVICILCLNNEIIIEIKLILLLKKSEENKCHYNKHMNLQPAPKQLKTIYTCMWLC